MSSESSDSEVEVRMPQSEEECDVDQGGMGEPAPAVDSDKDDDVVHDPVYLDEIRGHRNNVQYLGLQMESRAVGRSRPSTPVAGETTVRNSKRPYVKTEQYTGSEDWEEFISHFELCAELGGWSRRDKVLALAANLIGAARTFYTSLSLRERERYDVLVDRLGRRFGNARQQSKWLSHLEARKRTQGGVISALGDDLRQMAKRAYPELNLRAQEALALNQLYKTVSLQRRCMDKECRTISEAVEVIEKYEAIMGRDDKKSTVRAVTNQPEQSRNPTLGNSAEIVRVERTLQQVVQRLNRLERNNDRSNDRGRSRACYQCGSESHFIRDCPQARQNPAANNRNHQQPTVGRSQAENIRPLMS